MTSAKKDLKNRIRGWFPKEPGLPGNRMKAAKAWNPPKAMRVVIMVGILALMVIGVATGFITFLVPLSDSESFLVRRVIGLLPVLVGTAVVAIIIYTRRRPREDSAVGQILRRTIIGWRVRTIYPVCFGLAAGFMLSAAVVSLLGQPLPITYSLPLFFAFIGVGAVIGEWIGRKVDYRWPIWAQKDWEADEK